MPDVIVIGAGLVGCLTALQLAEAGLRCAILDESSGDRNASHGSAGGIYLQLQPLLAPARVVEAHGRALAPLVRASLNAWLRLVDRVPQVPLRTTGGLIVALDTGAMARLAAKVALESTLGLRSSLLDARDVLDISDDFHPGVSGGCYAPGEGHCEPVALMRAVQRTLRRHDVPVTTQRAVARLEQLSAGVRVTLRDGSRMDAPKVVLATGAHAAELLASLGADGGIEALPIQMSATSATHLRVPMLVRAAGHRLSLKQLDDGALWVGGGWPSVGHDRASGVTSISDDNQRANLAAAAAVVPGIAQLPIRRRWGGVAAWTHDGLPVLGPCPDAPDVVVACGGNGFSLAPLYAELLAGLVVGTGAALDLAAFRPGRFTTATSRTEASPITPD